MTWTRARAPTRATPGHITPLLGSGGRGSRRRWPASPGLRGTREQTFSRLKKRGKRRRSAGSSRARAVRASLGGGSRAASQGVRAATGGHAEGGQVLAPPPSEKRKRRLERRPPADARGGRRRRRPRSETRRTTPRMPGTRATATPPAPPTAEKVFSSASSSAAPSATATPVKKLESEEDASIPRRHPLLRPLLRRRGPRGEGGGVTLPAISASAASRARPGRAPRAARDAETAEERAAREQAKRERRDAASGAPRGKPRASTTACSTVARGRVGKKRMSVTGFEDRVHPRRARRGNARRRPALPQPKLLVAAPCERKSAGKKKRRGGETRTGSRAACNDTRGPTAHGHVRRRARDVTRASTPRSRRARVVPYVLLIKNAIDVCVRFHVETRLSPTLTRTTIVPRNAVQPHRYAPRPAAPPCSPAKHLVLAGSSFSSLSRTSSTLSV